MKSLLLFVCITMIGCAGTPLTEAERIQLQHEKEDKRLVRRDKLIAFLNACDNHPSYVLVEKRGMGRSPLPNNKRKDEAMEKHGYKYTHDNVGRQAHQADFMCMDPRDLFGHQDIKMFELAIALCHFAGPATTELSCTTIRTYTDDCVKTVQMLKEQYDNTEKFIKLAMCTKKKKINHPKIP